MNNTLVGLRTFASLKCGQLLGSRRFRGLFLKLLLEPIDGVLQVLNLGFERQLLRFQVMVLRYRVFKLLIEREHLTQLLLPNPPGFSDISDLPHNSPPEVEAQLPLGLGSGNYAEHGNDRIRP